MPDSPGVPGERHLVFAVLRLHVTDPRGLLLGFDALDEKAIRAGVTQLAAAVSRRILCSRT